MCTSGMREVGFPPPPVRDLRFYLTDIEDGCRLKLSLGLPKIQPRPPCPPRIYQKLYKYLDSALSAGARRSGRPPKQTEAPTSSPAKPRTPAKPSQSKARTPKSRSSHGQQAFASEVPKWVMPLIRHLCRALGAPAAPVHVFAGVSSILTLPAPKPANREGEKAHLEPPNVSALVIVVYLLVGTRLSGAPMPPEEFVRLRTLAIETIRGSGVGKAVEEVSEEASVVAHVTSWMREVSSNSWAELDWFANVPEGGGLSLDGGGENSDGSVGDGDSDWRHTNSMFKHLDVEEAEDETILRPGLGTMVGETVFPISKLIRHRCKTESTISASGASLNIRSGRKGYLCVLRR